MLFQLTSRSFRNLADLAWRPGAGRHFIFGPNGAGKTSLLEAIYLLATTRSFRTGQVSECRRHGQAQFEVCGEIGHEARIRLMVGLNESGRHRSVNDHNASLVEHLRVLPVVAWTAGDAEALVGPPEGRRRFLDQGVVGTRPVALEVISRYRRALLQKRQLLSSGGGGIDSWNEVLAAASSELVQMRQEYLRSLSAALMQVVATTPLDLPAIELEYRPSIRTDEGSAAEVLRALAAVRGEERRLARPLIGPHRDEVEIRWGEHELRRVASAGERKLVGLLLAAARGRVLEGVGRAPVYLLDDIDNDLDQQRLAAAWRAFAGRGQVFASSSRRTIAELASDASRWALSGGCLGSASGSGIPV